MDDAAAKAEPVLSPGRVAHGYLPCSALPAGLFVQPDPDCAGEQPDWHNLRFHGTGRAQAGRFSIKVRSSSRPRPKTPRNE